MRNRLSFLSFIHGILLFQISHYLQPILATLIVLAGTKVVCHSAIVVAFADNSLFICADEADKSETLVISTSEAR